MDDQPNCTARAMSAARIALGVASVCTIQPDPTDHKVLLDFIAEIATKSVELMPVCPAMDGWRDNFFEIDFAIGEWIGQQYREHRMIPDSAETCRRFARIVESEYIPY